MSSVKCSIRVKKWLQPVATVFVLALLLIMTGRPSPAMANVCQAVDPNGRETVTKIKGSKLKLYDRASKNGEPDIYKKKDVKECMPFVVVDKSHSGFVQILFGPNNKKWVEERKVQIGKRKKVKVNCLQVSQNTGSSRGAGESSCKQ